MTLYPFSLGDLANYIENNEWTVENLTSQRVVTTYGTDEYTDVTYHVIIQRRSEFYVMTMMFPCMLVSAIAAIGNTENSKLCIHVYTICFVSNNPI